MTPASLHVRCVDPASGKVKDEPVAMNNSRCRLRIRRLPGASAIHLLLRCPGGAALRAEIRPDMDDPVPVLVTLDAQAGLRISPGERRVLLLPVDDRYEPPPPLCSARDTGKLDLLFLVDATTQRLIAGNERDRLPARLAPLIDRMQPAAWQALADGLAELAKRLGADYPSVRTSALGFGDHSLEFLASSPDLLCAYAIYPALVEQRLLRPFSDEQLRARLRRIPPTSGGDFVDALAEGLEACGEVGWRPEARHLVILFGDSPGFSLSRATPTAADAHVRCLDVESEALRLHVRHQVEIGAIYAGVPPDALPYQVAAPETYLDFARDQYESLASHRSLYWSLAEFTPELAANAIRQSPQVLGRGVAYGVLEAVEDSGAAA